MSIVNDIFKRVVFDGDDRQYHFNLFNKIKSLAEDIHANAPDCDDKTLAFRALHMALMHAENAIAKKVKYNV
jgi:hypothetical protein